MTRTVGVVTDSTSYLPTELAAQKGILKVPVAVIVGGKPYQEGVDISTEEVAQALREWQPVTTSRPTPADMLKCYVQAAEQGYTSVVSAHLSSKLSGTYESAIIASRESPIPVTVVDTRTIAMAIGFACLSGAEAAENGASAEEVAAIIEGRALASKVYFYVDTLEYLRRGGRVSALSAAIGNMLRVKPILYMSDGAVEFLEKTRTAAKATQRIADLALEAAGGQAVDFAVQQLAAPERAKMLGDLLKEASPQSSVLDSEIGAVVGTHGGPGLCAVVVSPRSW